MSDLPPLGIEDDDEIVITWERAEERVTVTAELGTARITVESTYDDEGAAIWLVASLSNVMNAAWDAIEAEEEEQA